MVLGLSRPGQVLGYEEVRDPIFYKTARSDDAVLGLAIPINSDFNRNGWVKLETTFSANRMYGFLSIGLPRRRFTKQDWQAAVRKNPIPLVGAADPSADQRPNLISEGCYYYIDEVSLVEVSD